MNQTGSDTYGLMAEFETPEELLEAARRTYSEGYRTIDAYSPLPIHGLAAAIGFPRTNLPIFTFICGVVGAICGYALQYPTAAPSRRVPRDRAVHQGQRGVEGVQAAATTAGRVLNHGAVDQARR